MRFLHRQTLVMEGSRARRSPSQDDREQRVHAKRRKVSHSQDQLDLSRPSLFTGPSPNNGLSQKPSAVKDNCDDEKSKISISTTSKQAGQTIAPFLAKHIPGQYTPQGESHPSTGGQKNDSNTKYCYRHRPDLKCRRQADEPSMEQLQKV